MQLNYIIYILILVFCTVILKKYLFKNTNNIILTKNDVFFDYNKYYPELNIINENRDIIFKEFNNAIKTKIWNDWINGNHITLVPLNCCGFWSESVSNILPKTTNILKQIPGILSVSFSRLKPNTQLTPHQDWEKTSNNVLRCHYGLIVPQNCGSIIENWIEFIENNKWLVLDITKNHTSFNYSNEDRYIIIVDMKRPNDLLPGTSNIKTDKNVANEILKFFTIEQSTEIIKLLF